MAILSQNQDFGQIWLNGELVSWSEAKVHVMTHGLHYGSCVFEGERAYDEVIFRSEEHSARLINSGRIMDMKLPFSSAEICRAKSAVLAINCLDNAYVRAVAWRGPEKLGISAQANRINVAVAAWDWPSYYSHEERLRGLKLQISKWRRSGPATAPYDAKAAGLYVICTLSKHAAEKAGYADALMLDWRGQVAECTSSNIFFVFDGEIHTPKPDCFLDGITRRAVIGLAKARGYIVIERAIFPEELVLAEECFITASAAEVTAVSQIEQHRYSIGPVCRTMIADYNAIVRRKLAA